MFIYQREKKYKKIRCRRETARRSILFRNIVMYKKPQKVAQLSFLQMHTLSLDTSY